MIHLRFDEEVNEKCKCGHRTILLTLAGGTIWYADEDPYQSGEHDEDIASKEELALVENLVDGVELDTELSLHYCPVCETIVSFCANIKT